MKYSQSKEEWVQSRLSVEPWVIKIILFQWQSKNFKKITKNSKKKKIRLMQHTQSGLIWCLKFMLWLKLDCYINHFKIQNCKMTSVAKILDSYVNSRVWYSTIWYSLECRIPFCIAFCHFRGNVIPHVWCISSIPT